MNKSGRKNWSAWVDRFNAWALSILRRSKSTIKSERKQYIDAQADDLELAMQTLLDAIAKIIEKPVAALKTFEAVNNKLSELFPKVFGGGHAYLELTGDDILDTGVSLMAQPGKRNASVHLLSGGEEAMTAVALIFSIFHLIQAQCVFWMRLTHRTTLMSPGVWPY